MRLRRIQQVVSTRKGMHAMWSRWECVTNTWSIRARPSRVRSPTPVPASTRMSSSTSREVVRKLPPIPPLHPKTLTFITRPRCGGPSILRGSATRGYAPLHNRGMAHAASASRLVEELHLHARDLDQVVVVQRVRLGAE